MPPMFKASLGTQLVCEGRASKGSNFVHKGQSGQGAAIAVVCGKLVT